MQSFELIVMLTIYNISLQAIVNNKLLRTRTNKFPAGFNAQQVAPLCVLENEIVLY